MTALAADRITPKQEPQFQSYPVKAATRIWAGSIVAVDATGYAVPAADAVTTKVVGVAFHQADNLTGANGALWVDVEEGVFEFAATAITQAMVGRLMYVVDDQTFDDAIGTNSVVAGILVKFISTTRGMIYVRMPLA